MSRRAFAIAICGWIAAGACQVAVAQTAPGTVNGAPVVNGNPVLLGNGPATPIVTYGAPLPTSGISDAGRAGISNYQTVPSVLPAQPDTVVYYSQPGVLPLPTSPGTQLAAPASATEMAPATQPVEISGAVASPGDSGGRLRNDLGPSYYGQPSASASGESLAQISAGFKARKAFANARMLTNQAVQQMLNSKTGVTVAKNMPPLGPGPMPSGASTNEITAGNSAVAPQNPATAPPGAQTGSTSAARGSGQPKAGTPPPVDTTQGQPAGTEATTGNATTPSVNPNQQSNDAQGRSRLPATATFLPLLGLLGVVSGGIGWAFRKFRK